MKAAVHGISGGIMSDIQGGDFDSGFLSGAISSLVSSNGRCIKHVDTII